MSYLYKILICIKCKKYKHQKNNYVLQYEEEGLPDIKIALIKVKFGFLTYVVFDFLMIVW